VRCRTKNQTRHEGGEIVLLNLQAEKQFGYRRDELVLLISAFGPR